MTFPMRALLTSETPPRTYVGTNPDDCSVKDPDGMNAVTPAVALDAPGFVQFDFDLNTESHKEIWTVIRTPDSMSDSFWVVVNNKRLRWLTGKGDFHGEQMLTDSTTDSGIQQSCHFFAQGSHTMRIYVREPGADIDYINITDPRPLEMAGAEGCGGGCHPDGGSIARFEIDGLCGPDTGVSVMVGDAVCTDVKFESLTLISCKAPPLQGKAYNITVNITDGPRSVTSFLLYQQVPTKKNFIGLIVGVVAGALVIAIITGIVVYKLTAQQRAYRKMFNTAHIAEDMADHIAKMELDKLDYLDNIPNPTKTQKHFQTIHKALSYYKTYLPEALFSGWKTEGSNDGVSESSPTVSMRTSLNIPAPCEDGKASIVFTDIRGSTSVWEMCSNSMRKALKIHNRVIRDACREFTGYEVKTIGDAFMVAFSNSADAVQFALALQERLYEQTDWPAGLAESGLPQVAEGPGWKGLRIRIGVHCGEVDLQVDPYTGKTDYFGHTVNMAARIENACIAGSVCVSEEVLSEVRSQGMRLLGNPIELSMPMTQLKGVADLCNLGLLLPQSLASRKNDVADALRRKQFESTEQETLARSTSARARPGGAAYEMQKKQTFSTVTSATVAHLRVELTSVAQTAVDVHASVNAYIAMALLCSERTEGTVVSLHSNTVVLGWNTTTRCSSPPQAGTRFIGLVYKSLNTSAVKGHVGMSSSGVMSGKVGTRDQKFVTVIGEAVEVSERLVNLARQYDVFALAGALPRHRSVAADAGLRGLVRPVQHLTVPGERETVMVYELRCSHFLKGVTVGGFADDDEQVEWGWTDAYAQAFKEADHEAMVANSEDGVVRAVARRMALEAAEKTSTPPTRGGPSAEEPKSPAEAAAEGQVEVEI